MHDWADPLFHLQVADNCDAVTKANLPGQSLNYVDHHIAASGPHSPEA
jgi:hypothetical protein